jgi:serine protease AprX
MNTKVLITIQNPKERATALGVGCEILAEYPDSLLARCDDAQLTALQEARLEIAALPEPTVQIAGMSFLMGAARAANAAQPLLPDQNRRAYYLVELIGPAKAEWLKTLEALGGVIQSNFAGFTLLVGILPSQVAALQAEPWVESVTPYRPSMKVSPQLQSLYKGIVGVAVLLTDLEQPARAHQPFFAREL